MKRLVLAAVLASPSLALAAGLQGSKHDFSITGPGPIRAASEANPCVFCHVPHESRAGLSSRPDVGGGHQPYESSTMRHRAGAPTGATRVCLSCHDGTIAVGQTANKRIAMAGADRLPEGHRANLGTDLRGSHPVSFRVTQNEKTRAPGKGHVKLDRSGQLQCTSCHDPHTERNDPLVGKFLVKPAERSGLCLDCHDRSSVEPADAVHALSTARFGPAEGNEAGFVDVGQAGCLACHQTHGAKPGGRLVRPGTTADDACLRCHGSLAVTKVDLRRAASKRYSHAVGDGVHDEAEGPTGAGRRLPETSVGAPRHATCVDCHSPHAATSRPAVAPNASGALAGVWGIDIDGRRVDPVRFEYEVCFKCHGDSVNRPVGRALKRRSGETNLRRLFSSSAASSHPVASPGRNPSVPGLKAPYTSASMIYCTDCHASDDGPGAGGTGPRGPHGSAYENMLERPYSTVDNTPESPVAYALCYKCHDRTVLLAVPPTPGAPPSPDRSDFPLHRSHVVNASAPCAACHSAHGVASPGTLPSSQAHLVDFDSTIVSAGPGGLLEYRSLGKGRGSCNLTCHGVSHASATSTY